MCVVMSTSERTSRSKSEGISADMCSDVCNDVNSKNDMNKSGNVVVYVCNDVSDVNVEDEVSTTANSENDGTRDVPNNAGVSATCCLKIVSLNVCGLMSKMKYPEFREMLVSNDIICLTETKMPTILTASILMDSPAL